MKRTPDLSSTCSSGPDSHGTRALNCAIDVPDGCEVVQPHVKTIGLRVCENVEVPTWLDSNLTVTYTT